MIKNEFKGCSCQKCINCCSNSCGWFGSIEEVKGAAKLLGVPVKGFAQEYLIEEYWSGNPDISVIAPRKDFDRCSEEFLKNRFIFKDDILRNGKGFMRASWGHNLIIGIPCIFLDENNLCKIHESKPQECREAFACRENKSKGREEIAKYWEKHKSFINKLKRKEE